MPEVKKCAIGLSTFKKFYPVATYDLTSPNGLNAFMTAPVGKRRVGIINYDLAWRRTVLASLEGITLMLDESSLVQNPTARRTKFVMKLKPGAVILLSGTPTDGKYERLWTQARLLGWDISHKIYDEQYVNWITKRSVS